MFENSGIYFHNLDYGIYTCEEFITENLKYEIAIANKLNVRAVRLPEGRSNIIYFLSDSFENSLEAFKEKNRNFIMTPVYRKIYYPQILTGEFMKRRFRISNLPLKDKRTKLIEASSKTLRLVPTRNLTDPMNNYIIFLSDIYDAIKPIIQRMPFQRLMKEFFKEFMEIVNRITPEKNPKDIRPNSNNRILIIDAKAFGFKANDKMEDNKTNPLYLFYLAFLRLKDLTKLDVDIDMMICAQNLFMKFNPAKLEYRDLQKFKIGLFRIMGANLDEYTDRENTGDHAMIDQPIKNLKSMTAIRKAVEPMARPVSGDIQASLVDKIVNLIGSKKEAAPEKIKSVVYKKVETPVEDQLLNILGEPPKTVKKFVPEDEEPEDEIEQMDDEVEQIETDAIDAALNNKKIASEIDDEIQEKIAPLKTLDKSPVSSARDLKLREAQKKIRVQNSTIEDILARDTHNTQIETVDKSKALKTANQNMKKITFSNFNKTYMEKNYMKDMVSVLDQLKDKSSPFMITGVDIKDSSDQMNLKETWTVSLVDDQQKKHTLKFDMPKLYQDKFLWIGGNKYTILNQNYYIPLTKDSPNTVIMTTNFNKITIMRKETKSLSYIERMFATIKKADDTKMFKAGNLIKVNKEFVSNLEYDEYSKRLFSFVSDGCEIYFDRNYLKEHIKNVPSLKDNEFIIGTEKGQPIIMNEDTGVDRNGRSITDIMVEHLPSKLKEIYNSSKSPSLPMYCECKMAGQLMSVGGVLAIWIGITRLMKELKVKWQFHKDKSSLKRQPGRDYIKFKNGVLEYENPTYVQLIMNGLMKLNPGMYTFEEFDTDTPGNEYIKTIWGNYAGIPELQTFHEFLMDPITKETCESLNFPNTIEQLMIYAVKMLSDDQYVSKASDTLYRTRTCEILPAILHSCIAMQWKNYIKSGRRLPMTLNQNEVLKQLVGLKTVEEYSTLNPPFELAKLYTITSRGFHGSNSERSYDQEKRSYDKSSIGKLGISTNVDGSVGINRQLTIEPTIRNTRGIREVPEDINALKDVNLLSPLDMITPGTFRIDDPIRVSMADKQTGHMVPVAHAAPALVSNGFDEAIQFHLSNDFVINAEDDGQVVEVNDELGFIIVKYKNGKSQAISTSPQIVKNSGGGFYLANHMKTTVSKVGDTFKKDEPLAYHSEYFKYSKITGLRFCFGPLVKVGFLSTYNIYEDGGMATAKVSELMKTRVTYLEPATFKKNSNILWMAKVGDHVNVGDPLIRFNTAFEDTEISKYISKLSDDNKLAFEDELKTEIKSSHAGKIIDIKIYSLLPPEELSASLGKIVKDYFNKGNSRKALLSKYDKTEGIVKCGYMLTDSTQPVKNKYNTIKGKYKGVDVLIEFYLEHDLMLAMGDKVAMYSANKNVISEFIEKGYEPYSEYRPDEEVSMIISAGVINRRMVTSVLPIAGIMKIMIEMKNKIREMIKFSGGSNPIKEPKKEEIKTEEPKEEKK